MKNLFTKLTTLVFISMLMFTNLTAQVDWFYQYGPNEYVSPVDDEAKLFLGDVAPYSGETLSPVIHSSELDYRIKLLEMGGDYGGLYAYTAYKPSLHAIADQSTAIYAQTIGSRPAVLGIANYNPDFAGAEGNESVWMNGLQAGVAGLSETTGVYGYGNQIGGWFASQGTALYAGSTNGLAAQFSGNVQVDGNVQLNGPLRGTVHAGGIQIQTNTGLTELGAFNQWNSHFRTDRNQFYFYQKVRVAGNLRTDGTLYATALDISSDQRLKKDVEPFEYGLDAVLQMNPLTYDYNGEGGTKSGRYNVGLFAQDLQEIAPEFVTQFTHQEFGEDSQLKSEEDYLQIYDTGIKYMLVNATKEQQDIIDNQAKKIETLEETLAELKATVEALASSPRQVIELEGTSGKMLQNQPNPFRETTLIKYNIAEDASTAYITIYNINGQLMHREYIAQKGTGELQLQAGSLPAGTYSYALMIDGQLVDTKQMVITK